MNWKLLTLTTTSLVVLGLSAGQASAAAMGTVSMGVGHTWQDDDAVADANDDIDDDFANIYGSAKVNIPYSQTVNLQVDAFGDATFANESDDNNYGTGFGLGAHINYRDTSGLLGVFGSFGRSSSIDEDTASFSAFGFEGQLFCDTWTLLGQIGYLDSGDDDDANSEGDFLNSAGYIQGGVSYYANRNVRLSGVLTYADGEQNEDDVVLFEWVLGAEYLFSPAVPAGVFAEYRGVDIDQDDDDIGMQNHTLRFGVRIHFGATDLVTSDRSGASASLPEFQRWVSEAGEQID